jgi:hypothetical protein
MMEMMTFLIRIYQGKLHHVAHRMHTVNGVEGALCSQTPKPAVGDRSRSGLWEAVETLPPDVRVCRVCERIKQRLDNPLPARVERELEMMARWDPRAAAFQREKMLAFYREQQLKRP